METKTLAAYLAEMSEHCDLRDVAILYAGRTKSWHASVGGVFRGSSLEGPRAAIAGAVEKYDGFQKRKGSRERMKLDGPLEQRTDHEGLTYEQLRAEKFGTMSPPRACEAARRMWCLEEGKSTLPEDEDKWPKPEEDDDGQGRGDGTGGDRGDRQERDQ